MGIFNKIKKGLLKTKNSMIKKLEKVVNSFTKIDEELFEQLEEIMIMSDVGVETSIKICEVLRKKIKEYGVTDPAEIMGLLHEVVSEMMGDDIELDLSTTPSVILVIGVNGYGKTTTIGKMCRKYIRMGKRFCRRLIPLEQLQLISLRYGQSVLVLILLSMLRV